MMLIGCGFGGGSSTRDDQNADNQAEMSCEIEYAETEYYAYFPETAQLTLVEGCSVQEYTVSTITATTMNWRDNDRVVFFTRENGSDQDYGKIEGTWERKYDNDNQKTYIFYADNSVFVDACIVDNICYTCPTYECETVFFKDEDGDGYSGGAHRTSDQNHFYPPWELTAISGDIDDEDPAVYPGAPSDL